MNAGTEFREARDMRHLLNKAALEKPANLHRVDGSSRYGCESSPPLYSPKGRRQAFPCQTRFTEVLDTALSVYATTASLGGTAGTQYGFSVSAVGLGAYSFNVGSSGAAFGVANNTVLNIYQILKAANSQAVNGVLYNGNANLADLANAIFDDVNQTGDIS